MCFIPSACHCFGSTTFVSRASRLLLCELRSLHSVSVGAKPLSTGQCAPCRRLFLSQDAISCERTKSIPLLQGCPGKIEEVGVISYLISRSCIGSETGIQFPARLLPVKKPGSGIFHHTDISSSSGYYRSRYVLAVLSPEP